MSGPLWARFCQGSPSQTRPTGLSLGASAPPPLPLGRCFLGVATGSRVPARSCICFLRRPTTPWPSGRPIRRRGSGSPACVWANSVGRGARPRQGAASAGSGPASGRRPLPRFSRLGGPGANAPGLRYGSGSTSPSHLYLGPYRYLTSQLRLEGLDRLPGVCQEPGRGRRRQSPQGHLGKGAAVMGAEAAHQRSRRDGMRFRKVGPSRASAVWTGGHGSSGRAGAYSPLESHVIS